MKNCRLKRLWWTACVCIKWLKKWKLKLILIYHTDELKIEDRAKRCEGEWEREYMRVEWSWKSTTSQPTSGAFSFDSSSVRAPRCDAVVVIAGVQRVAIEKNKNSNNVYHKKISTYTKERNEENLKCFDVHWDDVRGYMLKAAINFQRRRQMHEQVRRDKEP